MNKFLVVFCFYLLVSTSAKAYENFGFSYGLDFPGYEYQSELKSQKIEKILASDIRLSIGVFYEKDLMFNLFFKPEISYQNSSFDYSLASVNSNFHQVELHYLNIELPLYYYLYEQKSTPYLYSSLKPSLLVYAHNYSRSELSSYQLYINLGAGYSYLNLFNVEAYASYKMLDQYEDKLLNLKDLGLGIKFSFNLGSFINNSRHVDHYDACPRIPQPR